jgi:hypothetical protein
MFCEGSSRAGDTGLAGKGAIGACLRGEQVFQQRRSDASSQRAGAKVCSGRDAWMDGGDPFPLLGDIWAIGLGRGSEKSPEAGPERP